MSTSLRIFAVSCMLTTMVVAAQNNSAASSSTNPSNASRFDEGKSQFPSVPSSTDPSYRLNAGDTLYITIGTQTNPAEGSASETISKKGDVRLPWLDDEIELEKKTVREAERYLEKLYRDRKMLKAPVVKVKVASYQLREVLVNGAVNRPGPFPFSADTVSMEIGDLIAKVGGFAPGAKADQVVVFHRDASGKEVPKTLDLEYLLPGKYRKAKSRDGETLIYPGDRIDVQVSIF
jgi:protein involved in polysaccharide export with SLBB domain